MSKGATMGFLDALRIIFQRDDFRLCTDEEELDGRFTSICVYTDLTESGHAGKLRWPRDGQPAYIDLELEELLLKAVGDESEA